jgi:hypothetical protein
MPPEETPTPAPNWLGRNQKVILLILTLLSWAVSAVIAVQKGETPPPLIVEREVDAPPIAGMGWVDSPEDVAAHLRDHAVPQFGETPAGRAAMAADGDVFLWDAAKKVTGDVLPARDQGSVGSCVSFGTASSVEHLICVQIASGRPGAYKDLAQEVIYGGSRVEVGGGKIRGDGSIGAWAVEWVKRWGVVPRGVHGRHDLTRYDESRCRSWGRSGVPDDLEPVARESPVKGYALVTSFEEADKAIRQGYPIVVCSGQGFKMARDADGFCRPSGTWYHCMSFIGARGGNKPGLFCLNSWGPNAHTGPRYPDDAPSAGFWVDPRTVDRMLGSWKDSFALSDAVGFPARKLDWNVRAAPARPRNPFAPLFARNDNEVTLSW